MEKLCILLVISLASVIALETWYPSKLKQSTYGYTSVCTDDFCDTLDVPEPGPDNRFVLVTSSKAGERFNYTKGIFRCSGSTTEDNGLNPTILEVNRKKLYRNSKILGFGGAFTGSVSYILSRLSPKLRACLYNSYFSLGDGARYNLIRIPIGCSDFDLENWAYNLWPENDQKLSNFTKLDARDRKRNQQFKEMKRITGRRNFQIFGCAWGSPPWMKVNQSEWTGQPSNPLRPEYYQTWADYHVKWTQLMIQDGMPIWAISGQNEPYFSQFVPIPGVTWKPRDQSKWLIENLTPALDRAGLSNIRIVGYEDERKEVSHWMEEMHNENNCSTKLMDFIGVHGYLDSKTDPNILNELNRRYQLPILCTEMSFKKVKLGSWERAEEFIDFLMSNLQHNVVGYIDWNIVLNSTGGPTTSGPLDAFIVVNDDFTAFEKQPMFYAMAHFSRFIPPGSIRIDTSISGMNSDAVKTVAYLRRDSKISIILFNSSNETVCLTIYDEYKGMTEITLNARSLNTIIYSTKNRRSNNRTRRRRTRNIADLYT